MKQTLQALLAIPILLLCIKTFATGEPNPTTKKVKRILIVVTSVGRVSANGKATGLWLEKFASPYYLFLGAGIEVTVASPLGGKAPIDPKSTLTDYLTETTKKFLADTVAQER